MSAKATSKELCVAEESLPKVDGEAITERTKALRDKYDLVLREPVPPRLMALVSRLRKNDRSKDS